MSYSSIVTIAELNSTGAQSKRTVTLRGPSLPLMGAEWAGANQLTTTWYPGNADEATQQNMGPRDLPSKWDGDWRRTMFGSAAPTYSDETGASSNLYFPHDLRDVLEDMFRTGGRLRVIWAVISNDSAGDEFLIGDTAVPRPGQRGSAQKPDNINARIVREGRAKSWHFKHMRMQDITWEIEFEWASRGVRTQRVTSTRSNSVASSSSAIQTKLAGMKVALDAAFNGKFNSNKLTLGQLQQLASYPTNILNSFGGQVSAITTDIGQLVNIATTLGSQPQQVLSRAINIGKTTSAQINSFRDALGRVPAELLTKKPTVGSMSRSFIFFGAQSDTAQDLNRTSRDFTRSLIEAAGQTNGAQLGVISVSSTASGNAIQNVYITKQGDTPKRVSMRFYNSPDHDIDLLKANRLPWFTPIFPQGTVIVIPVINNSSAPPGGGA